MLGGKQQDSVLLYRAMTQLPPKDMMAMVKKFKDEVLPTTDKDSKLNKISITALAPYLFNY